jgi:hypothetical protein
MSCGTKQQRLLREGAAEGNADSGFLDPFHL